MSQGSLAVGGLGVTGQDGSQIIVNVPSSGRIPDGATVERMVDTPFATAPSLMFTLRDAAFTTTQRVSDAINRTLGAGAASPNDPVALQVAPPLPAHPPIRLGSIIQQIQ